MYQKRQCFHSPNKSMSRFFLPSMILMMICSSSPTSCEQQDISFQKTAVHIRNDLSDPFRVQCQSKDNDIGMQTLNPGQLLSWRFVPHWFFGEDTLFFCHFYWGPHERIFDVYNNKVASYCSDKYTNDKICYWSVRSDGFYFSGTNGPNSYAFWYGWE
ncbi:S-protein homolog 29-like [Diospyros lotus]|uniref:S-protein homolog 29-like n=1 Tax=Diospyros lotus TaxID=55363 RepID=UPI00224D5F8D|nr:S-protein homolog 29-like [Diospyros lotus]